MGLAKRLDAGIGIITETRVASGGGGEKNREAGVRGDEGEGDVGVAGVVRKVEGWESSGTKTWCEAADKVSVKG